MVLYLTMKLDLLMIPGTQIKVLVVFITMMVLLLLIGCCFVVAIGTYGSTAGAFMLDLD
jgi:hypothetical protein